MHISLCGNTQLKEHKKLKFIKSSPDFSGNLGSNVYAPESKSNNWMKSKSSSLYTFTFWSQQRS